MSGALAAFGIGTRDTLELQVDDIQGGVLRGYRLSHAAHLFLSFGEPVASRAWVASLIPRVTNAAPYESKPDAVLNVAFTAAGLEALQVGDAVIASFPPEFTAADREWHGMAARAEALSDTADNAPRHWEKPLGRGTAHCLVMLQTKSQDQLDAEVAQLKATLGGVVSVVYEQQAHTLPHGSVHFGFADGIGQPAVAGEDGTGIESRPGQGAPDHPWRDINAGEFVFGYPDEEGFLPVAPQPESLSHNGTFMVWRKLEQDVAGFDAMLHEQARHFGGDAELVAAKVVGRWRDGTPVELSPERPDPELAADRQRNNDFYYGEDPRGTGCPLGSHIRRANPRDSLPFEGKLVNRHRMLRRGIPYGPAFEPGQADDGVERGLIFVCLQTSIERQFEFVQSQWLNDGNPLSLGEDRDVITSPQTGSSCKMTVPGTPPRFLSPLKSHVTTKGGEYLFMPGLRGLRWIATLGGALDASDVAPVD